MQHLLCSLAILALAATAEALLVAPKKTSSFMPRLVQDGHPMKDPVTSSTYQFYHTRYTAVRRSLSLLESSLLEAQTKDDMDQYAVVNIEYCTGCRWQLRSFWMAQELLTTFQDEAPLAAIVLCPSRPPAQGGRFVVTCHSPHQSNNSTVMIWDRSEQKGFPELKELKQLIRNQIVPNLDLGHSDTSDRETQASSQQFMIKNGVDPSSLMTLLKSISPSPSISIEYCTGCRWLLRAAYYAQELVTTFDKEINSIVLIPSRPPAKGGSFTISLDGSTTLWDRATQGGFPEITELKQRVRDQLDPSKSLGHSDKDRKQPSNNTMSPTDDINEQQAEEARKFFGVL